jgi:hypothetical protein
MYESFVDCDSAKSVRENFVVNFPKTQLQEQESSVNLRSFMDKNPTRNRRFITERKLYEIGARLEYTPQKSLRRFAQETGISESFLGKNLVWIPSHLNGIECVRVQGQHFYHPFIVYANCFYCCCGAPLMGKMLTAWHWAVQLRPVGGQ